MLAFHLVYLGSMMNFRFHPGVEEKLLTMIVSEWLREGRYTWTTHLMARNVPTAIHGVGSAIGLDSCHRSLRNPSSEGRLVHANSTYYIPMINIVYLDICAAIMESNSTLGWNRLALQVSKWDGCAAVGDILLNQISPSLVCKPLGSTAENGAEQLLDEGDHPPDEGFSSNNHTKYLV